MNQKDCQNPQMESCEADIEIAEMKEHLLLLNENYGMNSYRDNVRSGQYLEGIRQLTKIFELMPTELVGFRGDLPIFSAAVETEIARCISVCLPDAEPPTNDIAYIQALLHSYRVVVPLQSRTHSVSLHRIHVLLQDNYPNSCFCKLMNILLAGWMGSHTKTITF